jgi:hypothetical protein
MTVKPISRKAQRREKKEKNFLNSRTSEAKLTHSQLGHTGLEYTTADNTIFFFTQP